MQHASLTSSTYNKKLCHISVFGGKVSLIFLILFTSEVTNDLICILANLTKLSLWSMLTKPWMTQLSSFNQFGSTNVEFFQFSLRFHRDQTWFGIFNIIDIEITQHIHSIYLNNHAQTSIFDDCAGGPQGVQHIDQSNLGQVWAIRF